MRPKIEIRNPPNKKRCFGGTLHLLKYYSKPSKPVKFGGFFYVLVFTDYTAAHLLQRH